MTVPGFPRENHVGMGFLCTNSHSTSKMRNSNYIENTIKSMPEIEKLRSEAREYYGDTSAHGWEHACRVEALARRMAESENADKEIVRLGAIFHDIGREKETEGEIQDHAQWGKKETHSILTEYGYEPETVQSVTRCVESHRYSKGPQPDTLEASVVADADDLDALGAIGIARTFAHSGDFEKTVDHIREKILSLRDRIRTDTAREIAEKRHRFTQDFLDRFEQEKDQGDTPQSSPF